MKKVVLIGGKGSYVDLAEEIQDAHDRYGMDVEVLGFAFDDIAYAGGINGYPVLCGTTEAWEKYKDDADIFFTFGMFRYDIARERFALRDSYGIPLERYLTFVHPTAYVSKSAVLGYGCIVMANATIKNNVELGTCNFVNSNVNIGHDCKIGNDNFFAAHVCLGSSITVGNRNFFGLNSSVRTPAVIGDYNRIGMCANVLNDVDRDLVLVGNPARVLTKKITDNNNGGGVKVEICKLTSQQIQQLLLASVSDFPEYIDSEERLQYSDKWSKYAEFVLCYNSNGDIIGSICSYMNTYPTCYITYVSVMQSYKRNGVFRILENALIAEAQRRGFTKVTLEVSKDNIAAIAVYNKLGYKYTYDSPRKHSYMTKNI
jgi:sugar O-acyltransferase (sialic acid O-acetyltransferase NeuD family)